MSRLRASACLGALLALAMIPSCLGLGDTVSKDPASPDAGSHHDGGSLLDASWACTPKTCAELDANCGDTSDGCNGVLHCGKCPSGENCGAAGPNRCGVGACTPTSCAQAGAECGLIGDGCGNSLSCGGCSAPKTCGGPNQPNQCTCLPITCAQAGKDCGQLSDGCGGTLECGTCPTGKTCGAGGVANVCGCAATTCAAQGKDCGSIPDGCGASLNCGTCKAPKSCGGLGTPNVCGCSPADCPPIYQNSFEASSDFPTGWLTWQNCPTDTSWSVSREFYPAPSGGSYGLRLHTTGFVSACQYPGVYALSPPIGAQPGRTYRVLAMTRNAANVGSTDLLFYDAGEQQIGAQQTNWQSDAWQYHANPAVTAVAPAGSQALRVRFALATPSEYADIDLVQVHLEPL